MANVISDETIEYVGILAKLELSPEEKEEARQVLAGINPTATIYTDHYSSLPEKDWLHTSSAFWIICILYFWKFVGYYIFIYSSRLQMIPKEYYEYASLHGAGKWQSFYYITCPILFPVILFTLILSIMNAFKCYREAFLLGGTHPDNSIYFLQHFMNNNLQNLNYQKVSASATIITVFILFLSGLIYMIYYFLKRRTADA